MIIKKKIQKKDVIEEQPITDDKCELKVDEDNIDLFDLDNIDFKQRDERRSGNRRRGFRRIDDRNLISRAREEAQTIKEAAAKEGYQDGLQQSRTDIAELKNSLVAFLGAKQEIFEYIAPDLLELCVDIAKKIIKKEIEQDPSVIVDSIVEILKGLSKEEAKVTLRVNPSQTAFLKQEIPKIAEQIGLEARILVIPDETIDEGGCMVNTTNGVIDATIETQLSIVSEALKEI